MNIEEHSLDVCIRSMLNAESSCLNLAKAFSDYVVKCGEHSNDYRRLEILLRSGNYDRLFQKFILDTPLSNMVYIRRTLSDRYNTAKMGYTVYNCYSDDIDVKWLPWHLQEAVCYFNAFIVINSLCSCVKGEGIALVNRLCEMFPDSVIIGEAGCLLLCDYDNFEAGRISDPVDSLVKYYEKNGFININEHIGNYEESCIVGKFNGDYQKYIKHQLK